MLVPRIVKMTVTPPHWLLVLVLLAWDNLLYISHPVEYTGYKNPIQLSWEDNVISGYDIGHMLTALKSEKAARKLLCSTYA
jgi:hypothetical protein